jgi:hypothetical protein
MRRLRGLNNRYSRALYATVLAKMTAQTRTMRGNLPHMQVDSHTSMVRNAAGTTTAKRMPQIAQPVADL